MNYLALCQQLRQECGVSGTGPISVSNQTGENKRLVDWINSAWMELQLSKRDWKFLRGEFSFNTVVSHNAYTPAHAGIATRFRHWERESMRIYRTDIGDYDEQCLPPIPYEQYRQIYLTGNQTLGRPLVHSVGNNLSLLLGHYPDAIYTVTGEYYKKPQTLTTDTDIPEMPEEFHMLIVYLAMEKYAMFEAAPEVLASSKAYSSPMLSALMNDQLPEFQTAEALL